jgi:hypothetical protein
MKLGIARSVFFLGACCVASLAAAAWSEPGTQVVSHRAVDTCPVPTQARMLKQQRPDQDLLLFIFGLSQGMGRQS